MGMYRFDKYKSNASEGGLGEMTIVEFDESKVDALQKGVSEGCVIGEAVNFCRDMANEPANNMTPSDMVEQALKVAHTHGVELEVLERARMEELGMGALLGVAQGSEEPPKFIIMRYNGDADDEANNIGLLGKGITFDSGGLDIKNAAGMSTMKGDMAGGASVIAAMQAIARLKPKINVTVIVPATENMPSGTAQRPGDVVRAMNGKTIEIDNTDAEGRLVLADAMSYARVGWAEPAGGCCHADRGDVGGAGGPVHGEPSATTMSSRSRWLAPPIRWGIGHGLCRCSMSTSRSTAATLRTSRTRAVAAQGLSRAR